MMHKASNQREICSLTINTLNPLSQLVGGEYILETPNAENLGKSLGLISCLIGKNKNKKSLVDSKSYILNTKTKSH